MKFHADNVEYWSKDQIETVFFGNEAKRLVLLISSVPGTADHYLEWKDQSNSRYNAVEKIQLNGTELHVELSPEAAVQLGESSFTVDFECDKELFTEIERCLKLIFAERLLIKPAEIEKKATPKQDYSKIKYLNLECKNLTKLPNYVAEMTALETAKLGQNPQIDLFDAFEVLGRFPNLKDFSFSTEGAIPENLGNLAQLKTLTITGLTKPGALPESVGKLKKLRYLLIMSDSDVVLPDSFAELESLEELYMRVTGWQLPTQFYRLSKLKQLDFSYCRLKEVPQEMAGMDQVESVIFGCPEPRNYEQILPVVAKMPKVRALEMSVNPIPKAIGLCKNLEELIVWTGYGNETPLVLPDELFELTQLQVLLLSMNRFDEIPEGIGRMKGLKQLVLQESSFERLPESIGDLSNLEFLNLNENPLLQALPERLGDLIQLKELYIRDIPNLKELPQSLAKLVNLTAVNISNPETVKNVPESWSRLL